MYLGIQGLEHSGNVAHGEGAEAVVWSLLKTL